MTLIQADIKLGLLGRADNSGLGIQTHEFYRHMEPYRTMVVDISRLNGNKQYYERYDKDSTFIKGFPSLSDIDNFLQGLDMVFIAESPYSYELYSRARELGVKTAVQYNYEFFDWFVHPDWPIPDMLIAPSQWHFSRVKLFCETNKTKHIYLHCPVNRDLLPFREIRQARTFLHNAGRSASHDRNGTETIIEASRFLKSNAQIIIHFQGEQGLGHQTTNTIADYAKHLTLHGDEDKVTIEQVEFENYQNVYSEGDVMLLPRRYGGNCLPLNEALSVGMPVIMTDISPNNQLLPHSWLTPANKIDEFEPRTKIDIYETDPSILAAKIDEFYGLSEKEMLFENRMANNIAESISWEHMKPQYEKAFIDLCTQP